jgi:hypothetical protein
MDDRPDQVTWTSTPCRPDGPPRNCALGVFVWASPDPSVARMKTLVVPRPAGAQWATRMEQICARLGFLTRAGNYALLAYTFGPIVLMPRQATTIPPTSTHNLRQALR